MRIIRQYRLQGRHTTARAPVFATSRTIPELTFKARKTISPPILLWSKLLWFNWQWSKQLWPICHETYIHTSYSQLSPENNITDLITKADPGRNSYRSGGTRWRSWFRHLATSQKVAGSIRDGGTGIFHWHNPSGWVDPEAFNRNEYQEYFLWEEGLLHHLHMSTVLGASNLARPIQGLL